jgi:uncharacterized membrane protein YdbT with pleckstrin-like domain
MSENNPEKNIIYEGHLHWMLFYPSLQLFLLFLVASFFILFFNVIETLRGFGMPHYVFYLVFGAFFIYLLFSLAQQAVVLITTRIYMTKHKLFLRTGWLTIQQMELPLRQIESVSVNQDIFGMFFNYGDLAFYGTGGRQPRAFWVVNPSAFSAKLNELQDLATSLQLPATQENKPTGTD